MQVTNKQIDTMKKMVSWVSLKKLKHDGMPADKLEHVNQNLQGFKMLLSSNTIKQYSANSPLVQNVFNYLSNLLNYGKQHGMRILGKRDKPYYAKESYYKKRQLEEDYYHRHGHYIHL